MATVEEPLYIEESDYDDEDFFDEDSDFDDGENVAVVVTTKKTKATTKKATSTKTSKTSAATKKKKTVLGVSKNVDNIQSETTTTSTESDTVEPTKPTAKKTKKTVEEIYQKKSQREHILLRPDTYVGSVERLSGPMFVLDPTTERIVERDVTYTPGLYKIFDEIVVNAADNKQRDPNMDKLDITIDPEANEISVKNNGKGIPISMHKEHKCYVPTLIFGHLLTGSNFDDDEKKTTGGRNGYGAKLTNIFSTEFTIECVDAEQGLKFKQTFRNNMTETGEPILKKCTATEKKQGDSTKITFSPDLPRFKMTNLDNDIVGLISKRAYDIAGSMASRTGKKLSVTLNGKKLPIKNFQDYLKLYDGINPPSAYEKVNDRWEVGVATSESGSFQQVSFVNAICTSKGGQHVNAIADQVGVSLKKILAKKNKGGIEIKPNQIKNHLCVFVNALVENPTFDSQTKDFLTTQKKAFGSECKLSESFMKKVGKSDVVNAILQMAKFKEGQALKRQGGVKKIKLTGISKLDDANFAGGAKSKECTLIVTEGDSAKSLAMSGLSVVGRDRYGVFPLKGKPLNVREARHDQIMKNEEIKNLIDIMGLKFGVKYDETNIKTLRYGHLMIMADQDHDGSHIKGLMINFVHKFWPELLNIPGFLKQFITPIVKASKGKKTHTFFNLPEYEAWKESTGNNGKGWNIKYYKGLGTSTSVEAKEYFANLDVHEVQFDRLCEDETSVPVDTEMTGVDVVDVDSAIPEKVVSGTDLIDMAFKKDRVEDRKVWLNNLEKDTFLDYSLARENGVRFSEFINREYILFSKYDNVRSIAHVMDGFKPSQRKVLYACFKKKLKGEIKVAQLAGYIGEHSAYHHGEMSLTGTIVGMAQNYVGSNNINLLTPSGQFGTRRMGGKDSASPRYIFTKLEKITRAIFHPDDDALLNYLNDDGMSIEPEYYMPVIPMVLVNGCEGIGTGWSSNVPNFDPRAIISNLRKIINGEQISKMKPFYCGFEGDIVPQQKEGSYIATGKIERTDDTTLLITELPIKKWTQDYKEFLELLLNGDGKKKEPEIKDFQENHTDTTVSFTVTATKENIDSFEKEKNGLYGKFKLNASLSTTNMTLFDTEGRLVRHETPEDILCIFYETRLGFYVKRKELLLENLRREQKMLSNKARFVEEVCSGDLVVSNRKRTELLSDLKERGYDLMDNNKTNTQTNDDESENEDSDDTASDAELAKGYEYLLGMKIWSLTYEKAEKLREELEEKTKAVAELEATAPSQIWLNDLDEIEEALTERDLEMDAHLKAEAEAAKRHQNRKRKVTKKTVTKKKKKADEWDSDASDDDNDDEDFVVSKKPTARATKAKASTKTTVPVAKKQAAPKPVAKAPEKAAPSAPIKEESNDDDFEVGLSLQDRMRKKMKLVGNDTELPSHQREAADAEGDTDEDDAIDSLDDFDTSAYKAVSVTPAAKKAKKTITKKAATKKAATKKAPTKKAPTKKVAPKPKKQRVTVSLSDSECDDDDDDDIETSMTPVAPRARSGRSAARKTVDYAAMVDNDSDSDFE